MGLALSAVIDFLHAHQMAEEVVPLLALAGAVVDVQCGNQSPLLTAPKSGKRPSASLRLRLNLAVASAAISVLMEAGANENEAADKVARVLRSSDIPLPAKSRADVPLPRALQEWRSKLLQGRQGKEAQQIYRDALQGARSQGEVAAQALLETLAELGKKAPKPPVL